MAVVDENGDVEHIKESIANLSRSISITRLNLRIWCVYHFTMQLQPLLIKAQVDRNRDEDDDDADADDDDDDDDYNNNHDYYEEEEPGVNRF